MDLVKIQILIQSLTPNKCRPITSRGFSFLQEKLLEHRGGREVMVVILVLILPLVCWSRYLVVVCFCGGAEVQKSAKIHGTNIS